MKKSLKKPKSPFHIKDKVRVKDSYYTFSEEYPRDRFHMTSKRKQRLSKHRKMKLLSKVLLFIIITGVTFCVVRTALDISTLPIEENPEIILDLNAKEIFEKNGIRALTFPQNKITDTDYLRDFIKEVKRKNCNGAVVTFKSPDGKLSFTSETLYAVNSSANSVDNSAVKNLISAFHKENIVIIAKLSCFEDESVASANPDIAVKYMDTDVNFKDLSFKNGKYWLSPFSKEAREYIVSLIKELTSLGISSFMLESVQFPYSKEVGATYPDEKKNSDRNEVLMSFLSEVKKTVPESGYILLSESGTDAEKGNENFYHGSLNRGEFDAISPVTKERSEDIILNKDTDYSEIFFFYGNITKRFKNKTFAPEIDFNEYSKRFIRKMKNNGYTSYILNDESGIY